MRKPQVGLPVQYISGSIVFPAVILKVNEDDTVDLKIFGKWSEDDFSMSNITSDESSYWRYRFIETEL